MDHDMYPSSGDATSADSNRDSGDKPADEREEDKPSGMSALIPKSLCDGKNCKVGQEVKFRIVHEYEDELEIECCEGDYDKKEGKSDSPEMKGAMDRMSSIDEGG